VHDRQSPLAVLSVYMTGLTFSEDAVCPTGSSVSHTGAESMAGKICQKCCVHDRKDHLA